MTKIEEIREALLKREEHEREFIAWAVTVAQTIGDGFREYVGLPITYDDIGENKKKRYISYCAVDEETRTVHPETVHIRQAVDISMDDSFFFGLGVAIDRAENSFPKMRFLFFVRCTKEPTHLLVQFGDRETVPCPKDESTAGYNIEIVHAAMFDMFMKYFNARIGDHSGRQKIGFSTVNS